MSGNDNKPSDVSRRNFLKTAGLGAAIIPALPSAVTSAHATAAADTPLDRHALIAAIGDTLIPDDPGDPGYSALEAFNITAEVMKGLKGLSDGDLALFNSTAASLFGGKSFMEIGEAQRAEYLNAIIDGKRIDNQDVLDKLKGVYRMARLQVMLVYYRNYPEHIMPRDKDDVPILPANDVHQITNPNTTRIFTGWDRAGYHGPLTWDEEERRRVFYKKLDWQE